MYAYHAPQGAGAGSFEIARKRFREDARNVVQPHSVPLQQLADGGFVGLGLFVLFALARRRRVRVRAAPSRRPRARRGGSARRGSRRVRRALARRLQLGLPRRHRADDGRAGRARGGRTQRCSRRRRPLLAVAVVVVAVTVLVSFASPRLADRAGRSSTRALTAGDVESARDQALWARVFNPLAVEPLLALARVAERQGRVLRAERGVHPRGRAAAGEPGDLVHARHLRVRGARQHVRRVRFLNKAYTLDPVGNQWVDGGPLDVAKDAVNAGGCALGS